MSCSNQLVFLLQYRVYDLRSCVLSYMVIFTITDYNPSHYLSKLSSTLDYAAYRHYFGSSTSSRKSVHEEE